VRLERRGFNEKEMEKKRGFTLLETMVATLSLAILAIGGSASFTYGGSMIHRLQSQRNALSVAISVMEDQIRNVGVEALKKATEDRGGEAEFLETVSIDGIDYTAETTVFPLTVDDFMDVRVSVTARDIDPVSLGYRALISM